MMSDNGEVTEDLKLPKMNRGQIHGQLLQQCLLDVEDDVFKIVVS